MGPIQNRRNLQKNKSKDSGQKVIDIDTAGLEHISYGSAGASAEEQKYNQAMGIVIQHLQPQANQIADTLKQQISKINSQDTQMTGLLGTDQQQIPQLTTQNLAMILAMQKMFENFDRSDSSKTGNNASSNTMANVTVNVNNPVTVNEKTIQALRIVTGKQIGRAHV